MNLLVDFGNTRLKWALWSGGRRTLGGVFAHADTSLDAALGANWRALQRPQGIYVASVVKSDKEQELAELVEEQFDREARFVRSPAAGLGFTNAYRNNPGRLGVDRFLALATMHADNPRAQILVSCGTALTLDAIAADGTHLGGLIAPSPMLMRQSLGRATAQVGEEHGELVEIAANTADAAWSGCQLAAVALVERFRGTVSSRLGTEVAIVGDGGGLDEWLPLVPDLERGRDLVLRGLALWAEQDGQA